MTASRAKGGQTPKVGRISYEYVFFVLTSSRVGGGGNPNTSDTKALNGRKLHDCTSSFGCRATIQQVETHLSETNRNEFLTVTPQKTFHQIWTHLTCGVSESIPSRRTKKKDSEDRSCLQFDFKKKVHSTSWIGQALQLGDWLYLELATAMSQCSTL